MKGIITLYMAAVLAAGQVLAAPDDERGNRGGGRGQGRGSGQPVASSAGATMQRQSTAARDSSAATREFTRSRVSTPRTGASVSSNSTQTAVTRSDMARSNAVPTTSQTAIRATVPDRNSATLTRRSRSIDNDDARIQRFDGDDRNRVSRSFVDRDRRDRDGDRDWSDRRRYYRPPVTVYRNWDRNRVYSWNNNRYRWHGGTWVIYDASPTVVYSSDLPAVGSSVVAEVQAELRREGFYRGSVDGVLGPRTRDAIAEFQDANGLAVTGRINNALLRELDIR